MTNVYTRLLSLFESLLESGEMVEAINDWQYKEYAGNAKSAGSYKEKAKWHQKAGFAAAPHDPRRAERHFAAAGAASAAHQTGAGASDSTKRRVSKLLSKGTKGATQRKDDAKQLVKNVQPSA